MVVPFRFARSATLGRPDSGRVVPAVPVQCPAPPTGGGTRGGRSTTCPAVEMHDGRGDCAENQKKVEMPFSGRRKGPGSRSSGSRGRERCLCSPSIDRPPSASQKKGGLPPCSLAVCSCPEPGAEGRRTVRYCATCAGVGAMRPRAWGTAQACRSIVDWKALASRAGTPTTVVIGATSWMTTAPAPTTASYPTRRL